MVTLHYSSPNALFGGQLERRLEEVHEEPSRCIEPSQNTYGGEAFKSAVSDKTSDNGTILLFDPGLIVLFM